MDIYKRLLAYTRPYISKIILSLLCAAIAGGATGLSASLVKKVVDGIFVEKDQTMLLHIPLIVLTLVTIKGLASYGQDYSIEYVGQQVVLHLRNEIYRHIQTLSLKFFSKTESGTLVSRITNDVNLLQTAVATVIADTIRSVVTALALLIVVFYHHWKLAIISLVILPLAVSLVAYFGRKIRKNSHTLQVKMADINNLLYEKISGIRIVKAFSAEHIEIQRFSNVLQDYFRTSLYAVRIRAINSSLSEVLGGIGIAGVVWYGGYEVTQGITTPGTFATFITALLMLYEPLKRLSKFNLKIQQAVAAAERVFAILDMSPDTEDPEAIELPPIKNCVTYKMYRSI